MGYTHYFQHKIRFTNEEWKTICADVAVILTAVRQTENIAIGDGMGEPTSADLPGDPTGKEAYISFNGVGSHAYETFSFDQNRPALLSYQKPAQRGSSFCKTDRKDYDIAVTATLIYLTSVYPDKFTADSDGKPSDWQAGLELAKFALPRLGNVLQIPPVIVFDAQFSRHVFSGGRYSLAMLYNGKYCIADNLALAIVGTFETRESFEWLQTWCDRVAAERQRKLPCRSDLMDRWQARKVRTLIEAAESFNYLQKKPATA